MSLLSATLVVGAVAALLATVGSLLALAVNAASDLGRWPWGLDLIQLVVAARAPLHPAEPGNWQAWQLLAPHARQTLDTVSDLSEDLGSYVINANNALTYHLTARGSYPAAIDQGETVAATATTRLGEEHQSQAIPLYEATLAARERVLGQEHPDTLILRNNLAAARQHRDEGR